MKNIWLYIALIMVCPPLVFAQQMWERTYGGAGQDFGYSVQQTTDRGYIVAGTTNSFGNSDQVYLIKTDSLGDTLWTRTYGYTLDDRGYSVGQTTDGGYIVAGSTNSFGDSSQVYLIKTNAFGDTLWTRTYGDTLGQGGFSVQQTSDGGYIVAGNSRSLGNRDQVYLIRTDSAGDTLWTKTYGGPGDDVGNSVQETSDGGFIIGGTLGDTSSYDSSRMYLIKTNSSGDTLWSLRYKANLNNLGHSVQQTSDTGYIFLGYHRINVDLAGGLLIRTDAFGDTQWVKETGSGRSVKQTTDGGYIIGGRWSIPWPPYTMNALYKCNSSGDVVWHREYGSGQGRSVQQTLDGGYVLAGYTYSFGGDAYLVKTDSLGNSNDVEEKDNTASKTRVGVTFTSGPLQLPEGRSCRVFDIAGRVVKPDKIKPGIYFIEVNGIITSKIIKVK